MKELEKIGLSPGEAKVYYALIELGTSTAGPIVNTSHLSSSKIYDVLNRLIGKGLVSYVIKSKTRYYKAAEPVHLIDFIKNKEKELAVEEQNVRNLLPQLEATYTNAGKKEVAEIFEGINGIKTVFEMSLAETKRGDTIHLLGYPLLASQIFHEYNQDYHARRSKQGIKFRSIFNQNAWFSKKREKRSFIEQRYLPEDTVTPAFVIIFNDIVGNIIVTPNQKLCVLIRNKEVAQSYLNYFDMLWKQAVKPK